MCFVDIMFTYDPNWYHWCIYISISTYAQTTTNKTHQINTTVHAQTQNKTPHTGVTPHSPHRFTKILTVQTALCSYGLLGTGSPSRDINLFFHSAPKLWKSFVRWISVALRPLRPHWLSATESNGHLDFHTAQDWALNRSSPYGGRLHSKLTAVWCVHPILKWREKYSQASFPEDGLILGEGCRKPVLSLGQRLVDNLNCDHRPFSVKGAGIAQWLERRTRDWKVAGSNPCWNGGRIFFSRVDFLCWLLFRYPFHPRVTTVARKKSRSFCQKCRWQVTAKHAYTLRIEPCFGIGHNLSLICQITSEDIKHQLNNKFSVKHVAWSYFKPHGPRRNREFWP